MTEQNTITIEKATLWKVGFFVLLGLLLISYFNTAPTGNVVAGGTNPTAQAPTTQTDLVDAISKNAELFPTLGNSNAKITVTEFMDFQCPFCGVASGLVPWGDQVKDKYSNLYGISEKLRALANNGDIQFAVGIMSFLGSESVYAAQAGYCADAQGLFFEMHDAIFKAQTQGENSGKFNKDKLELLAGTISSLDQQKFKDCLENDDTLSLVQKSAQLTRNYATGTPTFYVNGQKVSSSSWSAVEQAIKALQ